MNNDAFWLERALIESGNGPDRQDLPSVHEPSGGVAQLLEADDFVEERRFDEGD
jgi:hypothetical protein